MINTTAIENALYTWAYDVLGIVVIFAHSGIDRPTVPYVVINILQTDQVGQAETERTLEADNTVTMEYSEVIELFITVNIYYENAFYNANKLKNSLDRVTVYEDLYEEGLGFLRSGSVRDIDEVIDDKWEERAQFDCFFSYRSLDSENLTTIGEIEIENQLDNDNIITIP